MISIAVNGATGRMGRSIATLAGGAPDIHLVGGLGRAARDEADARAAGYPRIAGMSDASALVSDADVVIDFSSPAALLGLLEDAGRALEGKGLVVGTTGLGEEHLSALEATQSRTAVLVAANFSIGVNLLLALVEQAARVLPAAEYDVEIVEAHHRRKADAPSGTALALGRAVAAGRGSVLEELRRDGRTGRTGERPPGEIAFHALRGGDIVGEHQVLFIGGRERIELGHAASDRALFAEGALAAARWIAGRAPGRYGMSQVLGLATD